MRGRIIIVMGSYRHLTTFFKWLAFDLAALVGAVAYVLLSNALSKSGGQVLAAIVLLLILAAIGYRLVQMLRNPAGAVRRRSER